MSNNNQQQNSFANLISKEEFEKFNIKEQENFLVLNKIYIPSRDIETGIPKRGNSTISKFDLNPPFADEIIEYFFERKKNDFTTQIKVGEIINKSKYLKNKEEQFIFIQEEIKRYTKKINNNGLAIDYQTIYEFPLIIWDENFQEYFVDNLILEEGLIEDYITDFEKMNFEHFYMFIMLNKLLKYKDIIEQLNSYKLEILSLNNANKSKFSKILTLNQCVILIDEIVTMYDKWDDLEDTKKARIICKLLNKDFDNTRKGLGLLRAKLDKQPSQFIKDRELISDLLNEILS